MKTIQFENAAYDDFVNWATPDKAIFRKITIYQLPDSSTPQINSCQL
jgi:hypothetical protein